MSTNDNGSGNVSTNGGGIGNRSNPGCAILHDHAANQQADGPLFHYTFAAHEDEIELCALEQRRLFGAETGPDGLLTCKDIGPDRSPFVRTRLSVLLIAQGLDALVQAVSEQTPPVLPPGLTFKAVCLRGGGLSYDERRSAERRLGAVVAGTADMKAPDMLFGAVPLTDGRWLFGALEQSGAVWLRHQFKPRHYSTALGTRAARAIANVAVPDPAGVRAVDPCCGIGTVLIEALSMGIAIEGFDINPLAVLGARENLSHFGYPPDLAAKADMRSLAGHYNTAVLDLPYNKCSDLPEAALRQMLDSLRRLAQAAVIVTVEAIDDAVIDAGFRIADRCSIPKGSFSRQVLVCT